MSEHAFTDAARFQRQADYIDNALLAQTPFEIIGAGAIGSAVTLLLAKMGGRKIRIWDPDVFEVHNLPNQMCRIADIGKLKVSAVAKMVKDFEGIDISSQAEKYTGECDINAFVLSCVDSMATRKEIWEEIKKKPIACFMDGRMGLTMMNLYTVVFPSSKMVKLYEATLWSDEEVAPVRCTAKSTIFTANIIAGLICNNIATILRGDRPAPSEIAIELKEPVMTVLDYTGKPLHSEEW